MRVQPFQEPMHCDHMMLEECRGIVSRMKENLPFLNSFPDDFCRVPWTQLGPRG